MDDFVRIRNLSTRWLSGAQGLQPGSGGGIRDPKYLVELALGSPTIVNLVMVLVAIPSRSGSRGGRLVGISLVAIMAAVLVFRYAALAFARADLLPVDRRLDRGTSSSRGSASAPAAPHVMRRGQRREPSSSLGMMSNDQLWLWSQAEMGQAFFSMRFVVQWIVSGGRERHSAVVLVLLHRRGLTLSTMRSTASSRPRRGAGIFVYSRNLYLIWRKRRRLQPPRPARTPPVGPSASVGFVIASSLSSPSRSVARCKSVSAF
jgi:lipid-A-disaccharide synthase-like uncharacterized protein